MTRWMWRLAVVALLAAITATAARAGEDYRGKGAGQFRARMRASFQMPDEAGAISLANGLDTGMRLKMDDDFTPEGDITYFFSDNIAVEFSLSSNRNDLSTQTGISLGHVWSMNPTLTGQYHVMPQGRMSPYVGGGVSFSGYYSASGANAPYDPVSFGDSFGLVLQAGLDIALSGPWSMNLDVKKYFTNSDVTFGNGAWKSSVDTNPIQIGVGFGIAF